MQEDDILMFSSKMRDIANKAFQLVKQYLEEKLVRKNLRSLPTRFCKKVAAIKEAKDVTMLALDNISGSLQTYKMNLSAQSKTKA